MARITGVVDTLGATLAVFGPRSRIFFGKPGVIVNSPEAKLMGSRVNLHFVSMLEYNSTSFQYLTTHSSTTAQTKKLKINT